MITIKELKLKINKNSRLIGLDLGSKRVGVSICDEKKLIATPLKTINLLGLSSLILELKAIINKYRIEGIIVGYPLNMDGSTGSSSQSIKDKVINISKEIHIPICLWDERLSTVGVFNISSQLDVNISRRTKKIDENAAAFILQGAIDYINN
ncbi:MAG: Holliday junction resolvase RuvX [Candidatus Pelagibacter bacterium]|jgi:putative Holliday junction resolvase|nr:Holliday junction resolvase RuvX [Candidatus Pelagibacter bacterium]|tara:strand:+ start:29 stop:484 length:456 start_codon:yes stop_codon:yes gene_type:complete